MDMDHPEKASNARKQSALTDAVVAQIRAEMAIARLSVRTLAQKSGVPERTLARLMSGERTLDVAQFERLTNALDVPMATILARAEERMRADRVGNGENSSTA
jgi:transcriptional regulator with XRE-family HTH domain